VYARTQGSRGAAAFRPPASAPPEPAKRGGGLNLILGGCAGLFVGALIGLVSGVILLFKSLKKFFT